MSLTTVLLGRDASRSHAALGVISEHLGWGQYEATLMGSPEGSHPETVIPCLFSSILNWREIVQDQNRSEQGVQLENKISSFWSLSLP